MTRFDVPKGHVDPGESELQRALRELQEETAIAPGDVELDRHFRFTTSYTVQPKKFNFDPCMKTLVMFLARLNREVDIIPREHTGYEWRAWNPPHHIQAETIDPLLAHLAEYVKHRLDAGTKPSAAFDYRNILAHSWNRGQWGKNAEA